MEGGRQELSFHEDEAFDIRILEKDIIDGGKEYFIAGK
jgi:hypothetical protein